MLRIQYWPIVRLFPYHRRIRKNDHAVDRMVACIRRFGFRLPLLVRSNGEVIDGHLRLTAAIKLGLQEVPASFVTSGPRKTSRLSDWP